MLTQQQLDAYDRDGVLLVENVADEATLAAMRRALAGLVARSASVTAHNDIYDLEPDHTAASPRLRRIKTPHAHEQGRGGHGRHLRGLYGSCPRPGGAIASRARRRTR